jgi:hypothetical protein
MVCSVCNTLKQTGNSVECSICFKVLNRNTNYTVLSCGHDYCASCIFENQKKCKSGDKCPQCRSFIVLSQNMKDNKIYKYIMNLISIFTYYMNSDSCQIYNRFQFL